MEKLIKYAFKLYPESLVCDMIKYIYQNEFGGGHMIKDRNKSLLMLKEEMANISFDEGEELFMDLGNNLVRLNLKRVKECALKGETINCFFINTAEKVKGNRVSFEEKLGVFLEMIKAGKLPYDIDEAISYIKEYRLAGYPPVSHSCVYKEHYSPSYRVIDRAYRDFFHVFNRIDSLLEGKESVTVAIDGNSCAGKTSLARLIGSCYDANIFHMDDFFLPLELRTKERLDTPGGNVHYERFEVEILKNISPGKSFTFKPFDCSIMDFKDEMKILPKKLNIIEGSYSMHPTLIKYYDLKIFLKIDGENQLKRLREREPEFLHEKFINHWIPMENMYFKALDIEAQCDMVLGKDTV